MIVHQNRSLTILTTDFNFTLIIQYIRNNATNRKLLFTYKNTYLIEQTRKPNVRNAK